MSFDNPVTSLPADAITGQIQGSQLAADAIDGKTITGALIRTEASGKRWEMTGAAAVDTLYGYTGQPAEQLPARIVVQSSTDQATQEITGSLFFTSPALSGKSNSFDYAEIFMAGKGINSTGATTPSRIVLSAQRIELQFAHDGIEPVTTWQPLNYGAGWADYGAAGFRPLSYMRDAAGNLHLDGLPHWSGSAAPGSGSVIATLPAGVTPAYQQMTTQFQQGGVACRIDVHPDGTITYVAGGTWPTAGAWVSLRACIRLD